VLVFAFAVFTRMSRRY